MLQLQWFNRLLPLVQKPVRSGKKRPARPRYSGSVLWITFSFAHFFACLGASPRCMKGIFLALAGGVNANCLSANSAAVPFFQSENSTVNSGAPGSFLEMILYLSGSGSPSFCTQISQSTSLLLKAKCLQDLPFTRSSFNSLPSVTGS